MTTQCAEEVLVEGNRKAFEQIYSRYYKALLRVITCIVKDPVEAEDLLQDAYIKAWLRFHCYDSAQGSLYTWLFNIARNTAFDSLRRRKLTFLPLGNEPVVMPIGCIGWPVVESIGVHCIARQELKPYQWQVIELAYWQGYTHQEIADQLGLPLGTIKSWIYQSLRRLQPLFR